MPVRSHFFNFPPHHRKLAPVPSQKEMKAEKDVEEVNKDKQNAGVCPNTQHPTLTNKQRGNEVTVRPATLDGKQHYAPGLSTFWPTVIATEND